MAESNDPRDVYNRQLQTRPLFLFSFAYSRSFRSILNTSLSYGQIYSYSCGSEGEDLFQHSLSFISKHIFEQRNNQRWKTL